MTRPPRVSLIGWNSLRELIASNILEKYILVYTQREARSRCHSDLIAESLGHSRSILERYTRERIMTTKLVTSGRKIRSVNRITLYTVALCVNIFFEPVVRRSAKTRAQLARQTFRANQRLKFYRAMSSSNASRACKPVRCSLLRSYASAPAN